MENDDKYVGRLIRKPGYWEGRLIGWLDHEGKRIWVVKIVSTRFPRELSIESLVAYEPLEGHGYFINEDEVGFKQVG